MLLTLGADVNAITEQKRAPLIYAASKGHAALVQLLLQSGAQPGARDVTGYTALHRAAATGACQVAGWAPSCWAHQVLRLRPGRCWLNAVLMRAAPAATALSATLSPNPPNALLPISSTAGCADITRLRLEADPKLLFEPVSDTPSPTHATRPISCCRTD